ncbi:lipoprotein [Castellaniella sp. GW247-6E4]|uniref:LPS translocon maturation chaperone LptM n=1 Tax=Castellaniella sp. GW247-6E4 TaxID=3140380 RepID=UPI00331506C6
MSTAPRRLGLTVLLAFFLSACGMKGPLTLPPPPAPDPGLTAPPSVAPAPTPVKP